MNPIGFFKQLADETRLRCIALLAAEGELCVCELTHGLGLSQPKISRHLAQLRELGIVESRKQGQWVYYRIHSGLPGWASLILTTFSESSVDVDPYSSDLNRLRQILNRPASVCCT